MKKPQCIHCLADIDSSTGLCTAQCLCEHYYNPQSDFLTTASFSCPSCGQTVETAMWRLQNAKKYLQYELIPQ